MNEFNRRSFLKISSLTAMSLPLIGFTNRTIGHKQKDMANKVKFTRDGLDLDPEEYSVLLKKLSSEQKMTIDSYSRGGIVKELEDKFATLLNKESAVFMPTGTLANHIALRHLAANKKKVIVQAESHIYNDSGDCAQNLSGLHLIPLAAGQTTFSLDEIKTELKRTKNGRVKTEIGVISIESPVRRKDNEMFDFAEMNKISAYARQNDIKMHLDGARLFNAVAHSGISTSEITSLFDTVYVSMYKNFNAASGAILAGSRAFCKDLYHTRRMFGGGMPQVWPFAVVASHFADSFLPEYKKAIIQFEKFSQLLNSDKHFRIEKISNGTNVFKLFVESKDIELFRQNLLKENIILPSPTSDNLFKLKINTTLNRMPIAELIKKFKQSV